MAGLRHFFQRNMTSSTYTLMEGRGRENLAVLIASKLVEEVNVLRCAASHTTTEGTAALASRGGRRRRASSRRAWRRCRQSAPPAPRLVTLPAEGAALPPTILRPSVQRGRAAGKAGNTSHPRAVGAASVRGCETNALHRADAVARASTATSTAASRDADETGVPAFLEVDDGGVSVVGVSVVGFSVAGVEDEGLSGAGVAGHRYDFSPGCATKGRGMHSLGSSIKLYRMALGGGQRSPTTHPWSAG